MESQQTVKLDENGEEIIMEGICYRKGVYWYYFYRALLLGIMAPLALVIVIPFYIVFVKVYCVKGFKIYLTKRNIQYHQPYPNCCGVKTLTIPLSYITSVEAVGATIRIYMEKRKVNAFLGNLYPNDGWLSILIPNYLALDYVDNSQEFVEAVKREINK